LSYPANIRYTQTDSKRLIVSSVVSDENPQSLYSDKCPYPVRHLPILAQKLAGNFSKTQIDA